MRRIADEFSLPIIVDGCNAVLPNLKNIPKYFDRGADLLVLSGGKTVQGPNDTGIVCGRKDLVEAARANQLSAHERDRQNDEGEQGADSRNLDCS